jgi:hypothetical protein
MTSRTLVTVPLFAILGGMTISVRAAGDKVAFPADFAGGVLYWTQDRPNGNQVRDYFTSRAAIDAAKRGAPFPSGTVITVVQYAARLDGDGKPARDASGRFAKDALRGFTVMEKRAGWGTEYPENVRNGEWEYQTFTAGRSPNASANLTNCFTCHKMVEKQDFVYSLENMKTADISRSPTR